MKKKTIAAVLYEINQPLRIIDITIPELLPGQLLVDVAFSGVCRTQLGEIKGKRGPDHYLPHTLGHEGSGTVLEIGPSVTKVKSGDKVVLSWIKGSGKIVASTTYQCETGPINSGAISTFMRRTVTCEACVTPISPKMPLSEAALLGCAVPTGCGIVLNTVKFQAGQSMAIFGMGGVGLSAALFAEMTGASIIIAVDILEKKLHIAKQFGVTHTINSAHQDILEKISAITDNLGVDCAIEAVGNPEIMSLAFQSVKIGGGICVIAGNVEPGQIMEIDPYNLIKGKRLQGTWGGESNMDRDIPFYINKFLNNELRLTRLISAEYSLENINSLFDDLEP